MHSGNFTTPFDGNGNPTTYLGTTFSFDPENRLTQIGSLLSCGYRAEGLRAWKQGSSGLTHFLYDGALPVCELNSNSSSQSARSLNAKDVAIRVSARERDGYERGAVWHRVGWLYTRSLSPFDCAFAVIRSGE